jgi:hypothetical protein
MPLPLRRAAAAPRKGNRMRAATAIALLALAALASAARAQVPDPAALFGHWHGDGRLYETKVNARCGPVPMRLEFGADGTLGGHVGAATIVASKPRVQTGKARIDYHARLDRRICPEGEGGKDHLVLLITRADAKVLHADFHLKSTFGYDWGMHPGALDARRQD